MAAPHGQRRILVSAVEPSGDRLGAELIAAIRTLSGNRAPIRFEGLVGPQMVAAGAVPVEGAQWAPPVMGGVEVLRHLGAFRRNRAALVAAMDTRPDLYLGIDAPDFHLGLARQARARGLRAVGYVSPQLWAWRPGRAPSVAAAYDQLLCLFSFEPALYAGTTLDARWVGHPVVDRVAPSRREPGVLAVFPGSRPAELSRHLDLFLDAAARFGAREVLLAQAPGITLPADPGPKVRIVTGEEALARADRALTKSGTVTLELALAGVPTVVAHRVHPLTYWIGRLLVHGVKHLALPNVLLREEVVPEYVQRFDAATLASRLAAAPEPPRDRLLAMLGPSGASLRAGAAVLEGFGAEPPGAATPPGPRSRR